MNYPAVRHQHFITIAIAFGQCNDGTVKL